MDIPHIHTPHPVLGLVVTIMLSAGALLLNAVQTASAIVPFMQIAACTATIIVAIATIKKFQREAKKKK